MREYNTQLAPMIPDEEKAKTTLLQSHPYQLWAKLNNDFPALNRLTEEKLGKEGEASVIYMEEVNLAIQNVYGLLKYIKDSQDIGQTAYKNISMRYQLIAQGEINPFTLSLLRSFKLSRSSGNGGRTMSNDSALNISGSSVEHSLTNTGSVVVTGSVIFK